jgi:hypothetical protein
MKTQSPKIVLPLFSLPFSPDPETMRDLATSLMTGSLTFSWLPLISTLVLCIAFIAAAIWRFNSQEY